MLSSVLAVTVAATTFPDPSCVLLAKGDGFAFHAVRSGYRVPATRPETTGKDGPGWVRNPYGSESEAGDLPWAVTHTDLRTGRMAKLFQGGWWHFRDGSPQIGRGMRTEHFHAFAPAFAADDRYFYLLFVTEIDRRGTDAKLTAELRVYAGSSGRLVATHTVEGYIRAPLDPLRGLVGPTRPQEGLVRIPIVEDGLKIGATVFRRTDRVLAPFPKR